MGGIPANYLPPPELWPETIYKLPEFQAYPEKINSTEEFLDKNVAGGRGDRVAIYYEDQKITYRQLLAQVNRFGNSLKALGIEEGDRVIIRSPNVPAALVANFAIIKIGAVCVPTSALFSRAEITHVANNSEAKAIVCFFGLLDELEKARNELKTVNRVIVIGGDPAQVQAKGYHPYQAMVQEGSEELAPVRRGRRDVAVLLYTSGTTGLPKGTVHLMEEALIVPDGFGKYAWRVTENDVIGGPAPLGFAAGYSTIAVIPFRFGAAVSLIPKFTPETLLELIGRHRITILSSLPTGYRKMLLIPDAEKKYDLSSLRMLTGGGESLTAETYHRWKEKFGQDIYEGLGTTEMMYVFISNAVNMRAKPGAAGQVVPGYEVRVINEAGENCKPGEIGRMIARGPTRTLYWRVNDDPGVMEKQKKVLVNGWNAVGDFVNMDEDGYVWFVSREDDLIKTSGYRVGPEEIEEALVKHPAVADAGVIGVPDPVRGQSAKAFVALVAGREPSEALEKELIEFCRGKVAVYKLPREIQFVPEVPRTVTGKILRRILRDRYL